MRNAKKVAQLLESEVVRERPCGTDTWVSMGDTTPVEEAVALFKDYQINDRLVSISKPDVIVMHCLPAHRGQEITPEVIDGPHSVIYDEAENRLHAQKAIMYTVLR